MNEQVVQAFAVAASEQDARLRMKYTVVTEGRKLYSNYNLESFACDA